MRTRLLLIPNQSARKQEYSLGYHCSLTFDLLSKSATDTISYSLIRLDFIVLVLAPSG